jgi:hypothetical protein
MLLYKTCHILYASYNKRKRVSCQALKNGDLSLFLKASLGDIPLKGLAGAQFIDTGSMDTARIVL